MSPAAARALADAMDALARVLREEADSTPVAGAKRWTVMQAAVFLGCRPSRARALAASGEIPGCSKVGQGWSFDPAEVQKYHERTQRTRRIRAA